MPLISFGMNDVSNFREIKRNIFDGDRLSVEKLSQYFEIQINYFEREDGEKNKHQIIPFRLCEEEDFLESGLGQDYVSTKMKSYEDPLSSNRMNALCPDMDRF